MYFSVVESIFSRWCLHWKCCRFGHSGQEPCNSVTLLSSKLQVYHFSLPNFLWEFNPNINLHFNPHRTWPLYNIALVATTHPFFCSRTKGEVSFHICFCLFNTKVVWTEHLVSVLSAFSKVEFKIIFTWDFKRKNRSQPTKKRQEHGSLQLKSSRSEWNGKLECYFLSVSCQHSSTVQNRDFGNS